MPTNRKWRFRTPCCDSTTIRWRQRRGAFQCRICGGHSPRLVDKKTGDLVDSRAVKA